MAEVLGAVVAYVVVVVVLLAMLAVPGIPVALVVRRMRRDRYETKKCEYDLGRTTGQIRLISRVAYHNLSIKDATSELAVLSQLVSQTDPFWWGWRNGQAELIRDLDEGSVTLKAAAVQREMVLPEEWED